MSECNPLAKIRRVTRSAWVLICLSATFQTTVHMDTHVHMTTKSCLKQFWGHWGWDPHTPVFSKSQKVFPRDPGHPKASLAEQSVDTLPFAAHMWHDSCRALAYETLGLFLAALTAGSNQQTRQVQLLLESLKRSVSQPFQQLPGVIAAFAAEAVFVLMSPGCAMYPPLNKLLLKRSELNIQVLPA